MIGLRTPDVQEELLAARLARAEGRLQACAAVGDVPGAYKARAEIKRASWALNKHLDRKEQENG